jgi:hypothetical protein
MQLKISNRNPFHLLKTNNGGSKTLCEQMSVAFASRSKSSTPISVQTGARLYSLASSVLEPFT